MVGYWLIVFVESFSGKTLGVLIIGIGSCYVKQEMLIKKHAVGVAGT